MTQTRRLKELEAEQAADLQKFCELSADVWSAASPKRIVEAHPFITTGIAALLGLTMTPSSRPASNSPSLVRGIMERMLSGAAQPATPTTESQPPIEQWVQGIQTILVAVQTMVPTSRGGLDIIIADAGSLPADSLSSQISL